MADPQVTVQLLDELVSLGFTDDAFSLLHHFREAGKQVTIEQHRKYCESRDRFNADSGNILVQQRLKWVLDEFKSGKHGSTPAVFQSLAARAYEEITST